MLLLSLIDITFVVSTSHYFTRFISAPYYLLLLSLHLVRSALRSRFHIRTPHLELAILPTHAVLSRRSA
ncbi:hypothetical protein BCR43DRAFT_484139 [Syncephalastrum racemosum]|uniref:Uncharacterized protein n=1 Tax=Syncephalastrum racemosum TaxID=13706 RepID=A0A1X2HXR1_SYNRA|nr:hypothetical protein BCR43DRAFT_484139 [Syncephalastrum racemosum]